jgi:UDP-GlcNAc:undecaprenyl-phosphate GlcNAc-1-phosphate transferase
MRSYLSAFVLAALFALALTPRAGRLGARIGALDRTRDPPIPRSGGLAILAASVLALLALAVVFTPARALLEYSRTELAAVYAGALAIVALGVVDDVRRLKPAPKLLVEVAIAVGLYVAGVRAATIWLPFGIVQLGEAAGLVFTVLWIVGITNAFNLLDGMDGLAAGAAIFALLAVFVTSVALGRPLVALLTVTLAGATMGFLRYNFFPARIYLGDVGSLLLGFLLATLSIEGATKGTTMVAIAIPIVAFGLPVMDTLIAVVRRAARGAPVFKGDREHLHHRLLDIGLTPRQAAALLYAVCAAFALASMLFINPNVRGTGVVLTMVGVLVWLAVRKLRVYELTELARSAQRGLAQTRAIAFNVDVRKAAHALEGAKSWEEIVATLTRLFDASEFDAVRLTLHDGFPGSPRRQFLLQQGQVIERPVPVHANQWGVHIPFELGGTAGLAGELAVFRSIGRKQLLTDLTLLVEVLRPALAEAAGRVAPPAPPSTLAPA